MKNTHHDKNENSPGAIGYLLSLTGPDWTGLDMALKPMDCSKVSVLPGKMIKKKVGGVLIMSAQ